MREWGKEFNDNRNWGEYNEELVVRGEFYLDPDFRDKWKGVLWSPFKLDNLIEESCCSYSASRRRALIQPDVPNVKDAF